MQTSFSLAQLADPDIAESERILRACVHCGFCTATCPTYVLLGDELDSPRGRIYLIKDMLEHDRPASAEVVKHIDRCLSCLACMPSWPRYCPTRGCCAGPCGPGAWLSPWLPCLRRSALTASPPCCTSRRPSFPPGRLTPAACSAPTDGARAADRKSTRLNSSHQIISYAVFCLKKKKKTTKIFIISKKQKKKKKKQ